MLFGCGKPVACYSTARSDLIWFVPLDVRNVLAKNDSSILAPAGIFVVLFVLVGIVFCSTCFFRRSSSSLLVAHLHCQASHYFVEIERLILSQRSFELCWARQSESLILYPSLVLGSRASDASTLRLSWRKLHFIDNLF